ncbi:MAG: sodium/solute symporter [Kiritimatiellae bacterium]|nr:sodium/solute symporter [Kiritimatiellia bacterium]
MGKFLLGCFFAVAMSWPVFPAPVRIEWKATETMPATVARPFHGFLPDGRFVVAGGSDFVDGKKVYNSEITVREPDGTWKKIGELPYPVAEGVCCETPKGIFCAGGTDGKTVFTEAFLLTIDNGTPRVSSLPSLHMPLSMGAAAADGEKVYVVASKKVWSLEMLKALDPDPAIRKHGEWVLVSEIADPAREQMVAAIQNGDQKEKLLVVYGGYDVKTKLPLADGYAITISSGKKKAISPLPEHTTSIGAAFLPSGHQHILLVGGFGEKGWIDRAINGSTETNPVKLGWQRKVLAYNCVTDAWCEYGKIAPGDKPRCGAATAIRPGKTPEQYTILIAGGEVAPKMRTDAVSVASFKKTGRFGAAAWAVVGVYALLMVAMAVYFIRKKKDVNDYFRGGKRIPWYVAGMSIFATMLSSITFIAIPTQAYLQDWRYFVMAFFIIGMAPVAIYFYLPFFCRLGITSAYEYLEKRFNLGVRLFGSAAFVVFMVCRVAVVTLLPAIALNAVTGISIDACILICGVLTMIYCSLGGLEAVIWSDFVQGIVLMGGAVSVLVLLIMKTGSDGTHFSTFWNVASTYNKTAMWDFRLLFTQPVFWVVAVQGLISNLSSYTSDQCVIQRYIATPDENATKRSLWFNGCMSVFAQVVFYGIGMALFTFYHTHPETMDVTMPKGDSILPTFMATEMPPWLAGLVIAAVFAATISTLSANLSSASTALVTDFIKRFKPDIPGKTQIRCGQICTYVVGIMGVMAALTLARMESSALFDNFNKYIAMLTAGLTGLFFMGVFMPRIKGVAAVLGLAANYFVCFSCEILHCNVFGLKFHPFLLGGIGLAVCVAVAWTTSIIFREKGHDLNGLTLKTLKPQTPSGEQ